MGTKEHITKVSQGTRFKKGDPRTKECAGKGGRKARRMEANRKRVETNIGLILDGISANLGLDIKLEDFTQKDDIKIRTYIRSLPIPALRQLVSNAEESDEIVGRIAYEAKKVIDEYDDDRRHDYEDDYRDRAFGKPKQTISTPDIAPHSPVGFALEKGNKA